MIPVDGVEPYAPFGAHTYQLDNRILTFRDSSGEQVGTMTMAEFAQWREEARKVSVRGPDYRQPTKPTTAKEPPCVKPTSATPAPCSLSNK